MAFNFAALLRHLFNITKPKPQPTQPPVEVHPLTVRVNNGHGDGVSGALVTTWWDAAAKTLTATSDAFGRTFFENIPSTANAAVKVEKDGYTTWQAGVGSSADVSVVLVANTATTGESQALHRVGKLMLRADASIFPYRAISRFGLLQRFALGQDVTPIIDEDVALGFNAERVIAIFDQFGIGGAQGTGLGECSPRTIPNFYQHVIGLTELAATRGMVIVWCYCADCDTRPDGTGGLMPDRATVQTHINQMDAALAGHWNVLRQGANEPFKNLRDVASYTFRRDIQPLDFGVETLDRGQGTMAHADWVGKHDHERKDDEFMRDPRSIDEMREGFDWALTSDEIKANPTWALGFEGTGTPVSADEPMGADEVPRGGSRASSPNDFRALAALSTLMGMGACFHSTDGIAARLLRPVTKQCAKEWIVGATFAPPEAQLAPYQRGGRGGGAGIGNMPIEHHDLDEAPVEPRSLRSFCKNVNGVEYCVRSRPIGATVARDGWRIVDEPRLGLVKLIR